MCLFRVNHDALIMSELSVRLRLVEENSAAQAGSDFSSDHQLMLQIANGDGAAFTKLIELHGQTIGILVGRLMGWHADCDDVLQEVFLTVWQKAGSFDGKGSLEGWLKKIAVNRCRNHFRTTNSIKRTIENFGQFLWSTNTQKTHSFDSNALDPDLQNAITQLPQTDRSILVLYYQEGHSGDEIARLMNIKLETLHVRLHRARKKLQKILDKQL